MGAVTGFLPFPYIGLYQGHSRPAVSGRAGPGFLPGVALWGLRAGYSAASARPMTSVPAALSVAVVMR